jgi:hypothetical protein
MNYWQGTKRVSMTKTSPADRQKEFEEKIAPYTPLVNALIDKEKELEGKLSGNGEEDALTRLDMAEEMLDLAACYIVECRIFLLVFGRQSEELLNEARKALYKGIAFIEEIVTPWLDVPFSDYEGNTAMLSGVSGERRYLIIRKAGLAADLLKALFGDSSRWKWAFVELDGRLAVAAKNILDVKKAAANIDLLSEEYKTTISHLRMTKKLLARAAKRYREKYELSNHVAGDFQRAISFLNALRRIHIMLNERDKAEVIKKKTDVWTARLKEDIRKKKEESRGEAAVGRQNTLFQKITEGLDASFRKK